MKQFVGTDITVTTSFGVFYYRGSVLHREDGPALIKFNGTQQWFIRGDRIQTTKDYQRLTHISDEDLVMLLLRFGDIK